MCPEIGIQGWVSIGRRPAAEARWPAQRRSKFSRQDEAGPTGASGSNCSFRDRRLASGHPLGGRLMTTMDNAVRHGFPTCLSRPKATRWRADLPRERLYARRPRPLRGRPGSDVQTTLALAPKAGVDFHASPRPPAARTDRLGHEPYHPIFSAHDPDRGDPPSFTRDPIPASQGLKS